MEKTGNIVQLSIDSPESNPNAHVYRKIDWWQGMFYNCSFGYVLEHFVGLPRDYFDSFLDDGNQFVKDIRGFGVRQYFTFEGINLNASYSSVLKLIVDSNKEGGSYKNCILDHVFESVQLQLTGHGLDFCRKHIKNFDARLHRQPELDDNGFPEWKPTRVDFAYDFVNFDIDFYKKCKDYLDDFCYKDGRVFVKCDNPRSSSKYVSLSYEVKSGRQRTIYIGSVNSKKFLRIYDKKLEQTDKKGCLMSHPSPDEGYQVDSWFRIEYQVDDEWAEKFLYSTQNLDSIIRYVYDHYAFVYPKDHPKAGEIVEFWQEILPWCEYERLVIGQNAYSKKVRELSDRIEDNVERSMPSVLSFIAKHGLDSYLRLLYAYLIYLQSSACSKQLRDKFDRYLHAMNGYSQDPLRGFSKIVVDCHEEFRINLKLLYPFFEDSLE